MAVFPEPADIEKRKFGITLKTRAVVAEGPECRNQINSCFWATRVAKTNSQNRTFPSSWLWTRRLKSNDGFHHISRTGSSIWRWGLVLRWHFFNRPNFFFFQIYTTRINWWSSGPYCESIASEKKDETYFRFLNCFEKGSKSFPKEQSLISK